MKKIFRRVRKIAYIFIFYYYLFLFIAVAIKVEEYSQYQNDVEEIPQPESQIFTIHDSFNIDKCFELSQPESPLTKAENQAFSSLDKPLDIIDCDPIDDIIDYDPIDEYMKQFNSDDHNNYIIY